MTSLWHPLRNLCTWLLSISLRIDGLAGPTTFL